MTSGTILDFCILRGDHFKREFKRKMTTEYERAAAASICKVANKLMALNLYPECENLVEAFDVSIVQNKYLVVYLSSY